MQLISEAEFLDWAARNGLHLDPQYPHSAVLTFRDTLIEARFWEVPGEPHLRAFFIGSLLQLLGPWEICYAWRHLGSWPASADPARLNDVVELRILKGLGLPLGTNDVVKFSRQEFDKLLTLLFSTTIFGWSVGEDLYVVPDHAQALVQTDHHDAVHVVCREAGDIHRWVEGMERQGFSLPSSVPDSTFKIPSWMTRSDD
jgi:hypothetical protein